MMLTWLEIAALVSFLIIGAVAFWKLHSLKKTLFTLQDDYPEQIDIEYHVEEDLPENVVELRPVNPFRLMVAEFLALESHLEKTDAYTYARIRMNLMRKARVMLGMRRS